MTSIWTFAEHLSGPVVAEWCSARAFEIETSGLSGLAGRALSKTLRAIFEQADQTTRDLLAHYLRRAARVSDARLNAGFWAAVGNDPRLVEKLESLASAEDRSLHLLATDGGLFDRVEAVTAFADHSRKRWRGYHLGKDFARSWTPDDIEAGLLKKVILEAITNVEGAERIIELEAFEILTTAKGWEGSRAFYYTVHIPDRAQRAGEWVDRRRITRVRTPNRRIDFVISPSAKTFEIVGSEGVASQVVDKVTASVAQKVLNQRGALDAFQRRNFYLGELRTRPPFRRHDEHGIKSVTVTKLVVGSGFGTVTYWAPVRSKRDVYDVIAASPGRSIRNRTIIAASIRIVFGAGPYAKRSRTVLLDITLPNASSLREEDPAHQLIIETYLREWKLLDPEEAEYTDHEALMALVEMLKGPPETATLASDLEGRFASYTRTLEAVGVLSRISEPESIFCFECSPPHVVTAVEDFGREFICPSAGALSSKGSGVACYVINRNVFATQLGAAIGADPDLFREIRAKSLWCLGVVPTPKPWTAFLAFDLTDKDVFSEVRQALDGPVGKEPGLLITTSDMPRDIPLPNGHKIAPLDETVRLTPRGLVVFPGIERALSGKPPRKQSGPTSRKTEALELLRSRRTHNLALPDHDDETRMIIELLRKKSPGKIPSFKEARYTWFAREFD